MSFDRVHWLVDRLAQAESRAAILEAANKKLAAALAEAQKEPEKPAKSKGKKG